MTQPTVAPRHSRSRAAILVTLVLALLQLAWVVPRFDGRGPLEDVEAGNAADPVNPDGAVADQPLPRVDGLPAAGTGASPATQPPAAAVQMPAPSAESADFSRLFAAQANAIQDPNDPATTRWAVLIGINDYRAPTRDNVGSRQDAEDLHSFLLGLGWRSDHILLLTEAAATMTAIEQAIAWLGSKTDGASTAVFHYSGHTKQVKSRNRDADLEVPDEEIWSHDNRQMADRELADRLAAVNAGRLWINFGTCEAAGFEDVGLRRPGRLLTFSSREPEKSYEDPSVANSVWGYFLIGRASDPDRNGDVTVQEAFAYAAPPTTQRTANQQPYGPQHPVIIDDAGPFSLQIPPRVQPPTGPGGAGQCIGEVCLPPLPDLGTLIP